MDGWHTVFLGLRAPPRELSDFELLTFFTFSASERSVIDERRLPAHRLGLALHIGFLRMSGRTLDAFRVVPPVLWRHLGKVLDCDVPELASLRAQPAGHFPLSDRSFCLDSVAVTSRIDNGRRPLKSTTQ